jgi:hypothetical protein
MRDRDKNDKPRVLYKHSKLELFGSSSSERDGAPGDGRGRGVGGGLKAFPAGRAGPWTTR